MKIKNNAELAKLIGKNIIHMNDVTYLPLKKQMSRFIREGNKYAQELLEDGEIGKPLHLTKDNVYWKWVVMSDYDPTEWISLGPRIEARDSMEEEAFEWIFEGVWQTSDGGDGVCINEYGLISSAHWGVPELNLQENSIEENLRVIKSNNLYNIFGLIPSDLQEGLIKRPIDLNIAIKSMPAYFKKYYKKLTGKVNEKDLITYLASADVDEQDLDDEDVYDWSSIEGIQAIIDDINLFVDYLEPNAYAGYLQWALNGWKN